MYLTQLIFDKPALLTECFRPGSGCTALQNGHRRGADVGIALFLSAAADRSELRLALRNLYSC